MIEHQFETETTGTAAIDYGELLYELRCRTTESLHARRAWLVREQRRLHVEELAVTRVLDERGQVNDSFAAADGVSIRSVRDTLATARALEDLPEIAAVAASGGLSGDQLNQVVRVAEPGNAGDDHRWAREGSSWSPADLAHEARLKRKPTVEDAAARRAARELRFWDRADTGMIGLHGELPDVDGVFVRNVFDHAAERMTPPRGQPWELRQRRYADVLVDLCRNYADVHAVAVGKVETVLSEKTRRVVRQRDGKCRFTGCDQRVGLEVHHLWPRSWGGTDDIWNLASVCAQHHARLAPQGDRLLLGNPNNPAGLSLVHRDDLPALAALAAAEARAGPDAV